MKYPLLRDVAPAATRSNPDDSWYSTGTRTNPASPAEPPDLARGIELYLDFQQMPVQSIGEFDGRMRIPSRGRLLGSGKWITYRSGKWDDGTHDYIHEFGPRVKIVDFDGGPGGVGIRVPASHRSAGTLIKLGTCLGFRFEHDGEETEAKTSGTKPELYCTPSGHALFVVEDKERVLVGMWGGKLGVEARGIVG